MGGGGGGNIVSAVTDPISSALGTDGSGSGLNLSGALNAVNNTFTGIGSSIGDTLASIDPGPAIGSGLASVDNAVNNAIPGGWGTVGAAVLTAATMGAASGTLAASLTADAVATADATAAGLGYTSAAEAVNAGVAAETLGLPAGTTVGDLGAVGGTASQGYVSTLAADPYAGLAGTSGNLAQTAAASDAALPTATTGSTISSLPSGGSTLTDPSLTAQIGASTPSTSTVGSLNASLPAAGAPEGTSIGMSASLPQNTVLGTGLNGGQIGMSYVADAAGNIMTDYLGNPIPASSINLQGLPTDTSSLSASDVLKSVNNARRVASLLTSGGGATSALNALTGTNTGTQVAGTGSSTTGGALPTVDTTITDLKPGLVKGSEFKFANEPTFIAQQTQMPATIQQPIDYTQQILNAASGGLIQGYAAGDSVEQPEAASPFLKADILRGHPLRSVGHFTPAQFSGYKPREFAEGGAIPEGHNPTFFSEGGLNSLENNYVQGEGDGTSDSVAAMLADGEFVIPADVVSDLGNGSNKAGAQVLQGLMATIREHKQNHDPKDLPPKSKTALAYLLDAKRKVG